MDFYLILEANFEHPTLRGFRGNLPVAGVTLRSPLPVVCQPFGLALLRLRV